MGIQFDGPSKIIELTSGTVSLSVRDLWSRWVDWFLTSDNSKFLPAMSVLGGEESDPVAGTIIPVYLDLLNGWRIKPQAGNHVLTVVDGVLKVEGGGDPFVDPASGVIRINYKQPVEAIAFAVGGGSGPTAQQIAAATLAAATATPIHADVHRVNNVEIIGTGVAGDSMRPAP